ncbi:MAG: DMT family transporter [Pseudomonadota bacterium]
MERIGSSVYQQNRTVIHLLAGAMLISFSSVWVNLAHVAPSVSAFYRVFFGTCVLFAATVLKREFQVLTVSVVLLVCVCGLLFALDLYFWHRSIGYIGPGLATLTSNFQVFILSAVGIFFFKEKLQWLFVVSIVCAILGLNLIVGVDWNTLGPDYRLGLFFGILTAVCYSGFLLMVRKIQTGRISFFYYLMLVSLVSSLALGLKIVLSGDTFVIPDLQSLLSLLALGVLSQVIGWVIISNSLPHLKPSHAGLILLLQPALSFVWDVLLFHRSTTTSNWVGVGVTLGAIYLGTMSRTRA